MKNRKELLAQVSSPKKSFSVSNFYSFLNNFKFLFLSHNKYGKLDQKKSRHDFFSRLIIISFWVKSFLVYKRKVCKSSHLFAKVKEKVGKKRLEKYQGLWTWEKYFFHFLREVEDAFSVLLVSWKVDCNTGKEKNPATGQIQEGMVSALHLMNAFVTYLDLFETILIVFYKMWKSVCKLWGG